MKHREKTRTTFLYVSFFFFQKGADFFQWEVDFFQKDADFFENGAVVLQKVNAIFPCGAAILER